MTVCHHLHFKIFEDPVIQRLLVDGVGGVEIDDYYLLGCIEPEVFYEVDGDASGDGDRALQLGAMVNAAFTSMYADECYSRCYS